MKIKYKRVLLKLSGEGLMGDEKFGISPKVLQSLALQIKNIVNSGVELCIVVGGGNIFRGAKGAAKGMNRTVADQVGMLATLMNALCLQNALEENGVDIKRVKFDESAVYEVIDGYTREAGVRNLERAIAKICRKLVIRKLKNNNSELDVHEIDISLVKEGELCPICKKPLKVTRGIEVGNIFQLGDKYSKPMNAVYTDENGELKPLKRIFPFLTNLQKSRDTIKSTFIKAYNNTEKGEEKKSPCFIFLLRRQKKMRSGSSVQKGEHRSDRRFRPQGKKRGS